MDIDHVSDCPVAQKAAWFPTLYRLIEQIRAIHQTMPVVRLRQIVQTTKIQTVRETCMFPEFVLNKTKFVPKKVCSKSEHALLISNSPRYGCWINLLPQIALASMSE